MKGFKSKSLALLCAVIMTVVCFGGLVGCGSDPISNETTRLVLSTAELDGVFNPFYSSSATDSNIIGMTQLSMITSDPQGNPAYGPDEASLVLDYEETVAPDNSKTTYKFVLKNDVKFSNGDPVTMKDVLFNLYVYLDPMYYGSSTVYSTDIIGLKEYRTQQKTTAAMDNFESIYLQQGIDRLTALTLIVNTIYTVDYKNVTPTEEQMMEALQVYSDMNNADYVKDYNQALYQLRTVMEQTWTASVGTAEDIKYMDSNNHEIHLNTDAEAFLYNWRLIEWNEKEDNDIGGKGNFVNNLSEAAAHLDKDALLNMVYKSHVHGDMLPVLTMYAYEELVTDFTAFEKQDYFDKMQAEGDMTTNVSGITFANLGKEVTVKSQKTGDVKTYSAIDKNSDYNSDGSLNSSDKYEILQIEVNEVDPKAIWNFSFGVAPMYYYSNAEQIALFDYESHFGIKFGDRDFMDNVIKDINKMGVPVGAGPYKATTRTGDSSNVTAATFKSDNVVYFERNENFMFPVKIKYVNYQVVANKQMLTSLYAGDVHFVEPGAKQEYIDDLDRHKGDGMSYSMALTNGYGYIGVNAAKVPNIKVRRAIMHAINTQLTVDYYLGYSSTINRSMSKANWAYPQYDPNEPKDVPGTPYYVSDGKQYYEYDSTGATSKALVEDAGYIPSGAKNSAGVPIYRHPTTGELLKYTFTIAGDTEDHPAFNALDMAASILNSIGFDIEVKTDINALKKLANGDLTVWAAAWSSTIDPDMYQVYHKDSTAGAVKNWGYNAILTRKDKYPEENSILTSLSELIDDGRETLERYNDGSKRGRKAIYAEALKLVMDLAVELPAYQRNDLFAFNTNIIDASTLVSGNDLTPYNGPLSRIWEVSLKETA